VYAPIASPERYVRRGGVFIMKGVLALLAVASLCACGGSGGSSSTSPNQNPSQPKVNTPPPAVNGVSVSNNAFSPKTMTVAVGTAVQWAWNTCTGDPYGGQQACTSHSVTFDDGSTSSPVQDQGTFTKSFATAGTFNYHCSVHGTAMTGTITVQ
jgi:plastocyanin